MLRAQQGQTAVEYVGVLLLVAGIIAVIAATDLGDRLRYETHRQVCLLVNDRADCPPSTKEIERRTARRKATAARRDRDGDGVTDAQERRYGTDPRSRDTDRDGVPDGVEIRRGTHREGPIASAAQWGAIKKAACKAGKVLAEGIDITTGVPIAGPMADAVCKAITKGIREAEKPIAEVVRKNCRRTPAPEINPMDICKKVVDKACSVLNRIDKRTCTAIRKIACFATDLNTFCSKLEKAKKRLDALHAARRKQVEIKFVGGNMRAFGRDHLNRATHVRANVTRTTVRHRRRNSKEGRANSNDVPGVKRICTDRGHLLARGLGGTGDTRNLVALPSQFNQQVMSKLERELIKNVDAGLKVFVEVKAEYRPGSRDPVPDFIVYRVVTKKAPKGVKPYNIEPPIRIPVPRPKC